MNRLPIVIIFLFIICFSKSKSALFIQLYSDNYGVSIDTTNFPNLSAKLKAYDNGQPLDLSIDNFYIYEHKYVGRPSKVEKVEDDYYKITWKTNRLEFYETETADIYLKHNGRTKKVQAGYYSPGVGTFVFSEYNMGNGKAMGAIYGAVNLGILEPVTKHNFYYCIDVKPPVDSATSHTDPFVLDSITVDNDKFEVEWLGTRVDRGPLPKALTNERYTLKISVTPDSYENIHTNLVFHYEPGLKKKIFFMANKLDLDAQTTLQLLEPNGGEIFAPCEEVEVKWKGHIKSLPVIISYSTDNGATWERAGKVIDSTYIWKVPDIISETVKLKVHQEFKNDDPLQFVDAPYRNWLVGYDNASTKVVAVAKAGKLNLYDIVGKNQIESRYLGEEDNYTFRFNVLGSAFTDDNNSYIIGYNDANNQKDGSSTYFSKFTIGKEQPDFTIAVGRDFEAEEMYKDYTSKYLVFRAHYASVLLLFDLETGAFIKEVDLDHPILSLELSRKEPVAIVHNMNNELNTYSFPDFTLLKSYDKTGFPVSYNINISPNGKYAFLAEENVERKPPLSTGPYYNDLIDLSNGDMVAFTGHNFSYINEIQFNPISTTVAIATSGVPQISFYDLKLNALLGYSLSIGGADLFDFQYAPDGHSIVSSMVGHPFIDITFFNYPEFDESDNFFAVRAPEFAGIDNHPIPMHLIAEERDYSYSDFCNIGDTKLFIKDAYFQSGRHFTLVEDFAGDTVYPGGCVNYSIVVNPKDVGFLKDTLIFAYCESMIKIPFEVESQNRHLGFDNEPIVLNEEVCVGEVYTETFTLFTNLDPIPIKINKIDFAKYPSNYKVVKPLVYDTIIQPGQSLTVDIQFIPSELGLDADSVQVFHSDADPYYIPLGIEGTGIGAFVAYSHDILPFIPESQERELQVINTGTTGFSLQGWSVEPEGSYEVTSSLPVYVAPGDTQIVKVKWNGDYLDQADLKWTAEPCLLQATVKLIQYTANYSLEIPDITTGPLDKVTIPIEYTFTQNSQYKGKRDFISEIKLYKRLFKPETVSSDFGEASILEEKTDDYYRYIKIKVNGDFDTTRGVAARITGYPGVADVIKTKIDFTEDAPQWGVNTQGTLNSGSLEITGVGARRLLTPDNPVIINSITPNPGNDVVTLDFKTKIDIELQVQVLDNLGQEVIIIPGKVYQQNDSNLLQIDCTMLPQGTYTAIMKSNEHVASKQLIILR